MRLRAAIAMGIEPPPPPPPARSPACPTPPLPKALPPIASGGGARRRARGAAGGRGGSARRQPPSRPSDESCEREERGACEVLPTTRNRRGSDAVVHRRVRRPLLRPPQLPLAAAPADIALTPAELDAAAPTAATRRCAARAAAGRDAPRPLRIAMFGTSVTAGNRCRAHGATFPQLLLQLGARPRRQPDARRLFAPGRVAHVHALVLRTLLPAASADLYVVEMTDNLAGAAASGGDLEQLLAAMCRCAPRGGGAAHAHRPDAACAA